MTGAGREIRGCDVERFMRYVSPEPNTGCWLWTGGGSRYGAYWQAGKFVGAHVFSCEAFNGPIQSGLQVDHLCRTEMCVNPAHLEAVSSSVNNLRKPRPRNQYSDATHCKHGHRLIGDNVRVRSSNGQRVCRICERKRLEAYKESYRAHG